jgi:hypothetical protein
MRKRHIITVEDFAKATMRMPMASAHPKRLDYELRVDKYGGYRHVFLLTNGDKRIETESLTGAIRRYNEEDFDA